MPKFKRLTRRLVIPIIALIGLGSTVSVSVIASNHKTSNHYQKANFGEIRSQLRQDLRQDGYYMMNIEADGNDRINVYAKKDNEPYLLKYTYPALELISSDKKQWSTIWQYKNDHQQQNQARDDIEDSIKKEDRYPMIKQRAIGKITDMGYLVEDIELEEENNRGVFEIEAKRDSQDYEIVLGYPDLEIIKLKKD